MKQTISVKPAELRFEVEDGETMLSAAIRAGVGLPYGCRDGACGSCKSRLLDGRVVHASHQAKALSADEEAAGWILTCRATPTEACTISARTYAASDQPVIKMPARVMRIDRAAADVAVLRLQLPANQRFGFRAGQYVEIILRDGSRRSYSMANSPERLGDPPAIELHLRHMPGGLFTDHVFGAMKEKEILRLEGPYGSFFLRTDSDKPIVMLASGTGFAPIKAMIEQIETKPVERAIALYWGARTRPDLYFDDWARAAALRIPRLSYIPVLSEPRPEDDWCGRTGFVHRAVMDDLPDLSGHQVYACGVPVMVDSAQRDFTAECGLPADEFFADAFTSEAEKHLASP